MGGSEAKDQDLTALSERQDRGDYSVSAVDTSAIAVSTTEPVSTGELPKVPVCELRG